jgi:hypothetical protein
MFLVERNAIVSTGNVAAVFGGTLGGTFRNNGIYNGTLAVASGGSVGGSGTFDTAVTFGTVTLDSLGQNANAYGSFATTQIGNDVYLTWTAIPEPSTYALLLGGGGGAGALKQPCST